MTTVHLWRGHHGPAFQQLFAHCWDRGELLIACPPTPIDPSFVEQLPAGNLKLAGDWTGLPPPRRAGPGRAYPAPPVLGVFTTGTTRAAQKVVLFSHANIAASQDAIFALYDAARIDSVFCYPQPYHVFGLLLGFALARRRGLRVLFADGPYSRAAHERWRAHAGSHLLTLATPSHMLDLCAHLEASGAGPEGAAGRPRPTYACILGGATVDRRVWLEARTVAAIEQPSIGYGCTEASPGICHLPPGREPLVDGEVGWPLPYVNMGPAGDDGYTLRGPGVCLATIEAGQLAFPTAHQVRDELVPLGDGRLAFRGRHDLVLNRGGEKFLLERLEAVLRERCGIDSICVAVPDTRLGAELGIVARRHPALPPPPAIYAALWAAFGRQFSPAHLFVVDALPLNPNAKPDRRAAARLFAP